jgi:dTDP-4-dehydrorhamnose 3,5-epimerase
MKTIETKLPGLLIHEPRVFADPRGIFFEAYSDARPVDTASAFKIVQLNVSESEQFVLRGLHYQLPYPQAKLVWVLEGEVFDVAVDIRRGSPTYGQWDGAMLSRKNRRQLFVPSGFAHGFQVVSNSATLCYACSEQFRANCDRGIRFDDPTIAIQWPEPSRALISQKDADAKYLSNLDDHALPTL